MVYQCIDIDVRRLVSLASNIHGSEHNPPYDKVKFLEFYPQFGGDKIPETVIDYYIALANSCLSYDMYGDIWTLQMNLYIAHFLSLYLQSTNNLTANSPANKVIQASLSYGLVSSKSAGDLSKSYDYSSVNEDLNGWAAWKLTIFGQQFASNAKLIGKAGSFIW